MNTDIISVSPVLCKNLVEGFESLSHKIPADWYIMEVYKAAYSFDVRVAGHFNIVMFQVSRQTIKAWTHWNPQKPDIALTI